MLKSIVDQIVKCTEARSREEAASRGITYEELQEERRKEAARREAEAEARDREQAKEHDKAVKLQTQRRRELGDRLSLGVACHIGHIIKLGGLTERSSGNGFTRGTVYHLVLDESLAYGRLRRSAGDMLCKPTSRLGWRTFGVQGDQFQSDLAEELTEGEVTCKLCREILQRIGRKRGSSDSDRR